jgi:C4-dicarboxylate transporter DctM subunit
MTGFLVGISENPRALTMIMVGFVLFLGCFMTDAAIVPILAPLLLPVIRRVGIDPVQFGVILCMTAVTGNLTPPVGGLLYVTSAIGNVPVMSTARAVIPFLIVIIITITLCSLIPQMVTFLPDFLLR